MDESNWLTIFAIGVPVTWALLVTLFAVALARRDWLIVVTFVILGAALGVVTLDAIRSGVW